MDYSLMYNLLLSNHCGEGDLYQNTVYCQTGQTPENDYVILRERTSSQKRDVERALTRFVAKTGMSLPLLPDDKNAFPC